MKLTLKGLSERLAKVERSGLTTAGGTGTDPAFVASTNAALGALDTRLDVIEALPSLEPVEFSIGDGAASLFALPHNTGRLYPSNVSVWDQIINVNVAGFDYLPIDVNNGAIAFPGYVPTFLQFVVRISP